MVLRKALFHTGFFFSAVRDLDVPSLSDRSRGADKESHVRR